MSLLERTKSNFFWGGCGMNVGEWRFVVIFNLFSNVSGCHKIAEFICECPQSFDIFKRHVSKYFFFLVGGFNLTFKVKFCQKLKVRKNSSHIFCCFPKFCEWDIRGLCKFEWFTSRPTVAENQHKVFVVDLWPETWHLCSMGLGPSVVSSGCACPSSEPCRNVQVLPVLPGPFFFFRFGFVVCLAMNCFIEIYLQHHVEHGWNNERLSSLSRTPFAIHYTGVLYS